MRRWFGRLAAGVLLAFAAPGCDHWAGVCDCDCSCHNSCCYGLGGYHGVMGEYPAVNGLIGNGPIGNGVIVGPEVQTAPAPKPEPIKPKL